MKEFPGNKNEIKTVDKTNTILFERGPNAINTTIFVYNRKIIYLKLFCFS